jgi:serine/threonine protein kinase
VHDRADGAAAFLTVLSKQSLILTHLQLSVMQHMHSRGLIHRDVKPANIVASISNQNHFVLVDYGLAVPFSPLATVSDRASRSENMEWGVDGSLMFVSLDAHENLRE